MIYDVVISEKVKKKDLPKLPKHILVKFYSWISSVGHLGLEEVRKFSGYHDEPLKGERLGQRSIRLSKAYRAIYVVKDDGNIEFVEVMEVNKHDY
jgi:proteic killer suppression protein